MRNIIVLSFVVLFLLSLTGCQAQSEYKHLESAPLELEEQAVYTEYPELSEPEEKEPNSSPYESDFYFYENVLIELGASRGTLDGNPVIWRDSFFSLVGWTWDAQTLSVEYYFRWLLEWVQKNQLNSVFARFETGDADTGFTVNADFFEGVITSWFEVSLEHLRSDLDIYHSANREYRMGIYAGLGAIPYIQIVDVERDGDYAYIAIIIKYPHDGPPVQESTFVIRHLEDGTFRFIRSFAAK